ncbi:MAG TPA: G/U mismatch-specific DNA glycosylase [Tahibacter sp.]|nr:G/U mismatch-specific DNA glycosylase [Tahibacter sp.]
MNPLPDLLAPNLAVVFCGINPGLRSAELGHHFAGRNNRFWTVLHRAGFTPTVFAPEDDARLVDHGCGLTTTVARASASAADLDAADFKDARQSLENRLTHLAPRYIAFLGRDAYKPFAGSRTVPWGRQPDRVCGNAIAWLLPNPSGLNRMSLDALADAYAQLHHAAF